MTEQRYHPFSNGTQFADWHESNCMRCTKRNPDKCTPDDPGCDMEMWLSLGGDGQTAETAGDGSVSADLAQRCGYLEHQGRYCWPCGEVEWTDAWKEEFARKRGYASAADYAARQEVSS